MAPSTTAFPELAESAATGRTAEVYAALRNLTGVPVVAQIFRHLATRPGLLDEVWTALAPLLATGWIQEAGPGVVERVLPASLLPPIGPDLRQAIGLSDEQLTPIVNAIDSYNRANATNFLIMMSLIERLRLPDTAYRPPPAGQWLPPVPIRGPLSRMVPPAEMPLHIRRLVNDFGFGDRSSLDAVVPSLLRHFADTPAFLAVLHIAVAPKFVDGTMARAIDALKTAVGTEASRLAPWVAPVPALAADADTLRVINEFTDTWIPQMTLIGFALRRALTGLADR